MKKEPLQETISFRLTASEYAPYKKLLQETGLKKSSLFRELAISKADKITLPKEQTPASKRLIFIANQTADHINQIAHKLNQAHQSHTLNDQIYQQTLNHLISLERTFAQAIKQC